MSNAKVYQMKLIMGKTPNYDKDGKLKNTVVTPKYTGEMELTNLVGDGNYKSLGVCEIECIDCFDSSDIKVKYPERIKEVNDLIKGGVKTRPKTELEILREEVAEMREAMKTQPKDTSILSSTVLNTVYDDDGRLIESTRATLEAKANELEIPFRSNIGDAKLLAKILEVDPEFKV